MPVTWLHYNVLEKPFKAIFYFAMTGCNENLYQKDLYQKDTALKFTISLSLNIYFKITVSNNKAFQNNYDYYSLKLYEGKRVNPVTDT